MAQRSMAPGLQRWQLHGVPAPHSPALTGLLGSRRPSGSKRGRAPGRGVGGGDGVSRLGGGRDEPATAAWIAAWLLGSTVAAVPCHRCEGQREGGSGGAGTAGPCRLQRHHPQPSEGLAWPPPLPLPETHRPGCLQPDPRGGAVGAVPRGGPFSKRAIQGSEVRSAVQPSAPTSCSP